MQKRPGGRARCPSIPQPTTHVNQPTRSQPHATPPRKRHARADRFLVFARSFLQHPRMLGSIVPSSQFLVNRLLGQIDFDRARVIVEYGPGVGPITTALLARMRPDARLIALETNAKLAEFLRSSIRDPRLHVAEDSAEAVDVVLARMGLTSADYVISGIPFSTIPAATRRAIVRTTHTVLGGTGSFLIYQFSRAVLPDLRAAFGEVREEFEPLNIPPAQMFYCRG